MEKMKKINSKATFLLIMCFCLFMASSCSGGNGLSYKSGSFEGEADSFIGSLKVSVTIERNRIKQVDILEYSDTPGYSNVVFEHLPKKVRIDNIDELDTISGATTSSKAFLQAVKNALEKAKKLEE